MNDASRMRPLMMELNALAEILLASVLLLAHDRRDGSDIAGSHVIRAAAKALLHLEKPKSRNRKEEEAPEDDGTRLLIAISKLSGETRHVLRNQGVGAWTYMERRDGTCQTHTSGTKDCVLYWLAEAGERK